MSLCPDAARRDAMDDGEFWEWVARGMGVACPPDLDVDFDELTRTVADLGECAVCHTLGPCGWDDEGRPWIHVDDSEDHDTDRALG